MEPWNHYSHISLCFLADNQNKPCAESFKCWIGIVKCIQDGTSNQPKFWAETSNFVFKSECSKELKLIPFSPVLLSSGLAFQAIDFPAVFIQIKLYTVHSGSFTIFPSFLSRFKSLGFLSFSSCQACFMFSASFRKGKWADFCSAVSVCALNTCVLHSGYRLLANK